VSERTSSAELRAVCGVLRYEASREGGVETVGSRAYASSSQEVIMKHTLIAIGLLATISRASPAFARSGGIHSEDPWNPQHISGLPSDVRNALARMCRGESRAQHQFARYFQNSRTLVLHFEHFRCGDRGALCTQAGCLHQVYTSTDGRYRLLRSYYGPEGD
jgi:hypothetical protein